MPFTVSPTMFIGIGSNGWRILEELRRLMFEEFGRAGLPCFRYIALETIAGRQPDDSFLPHMPDDHERIDAVSMTVYDVTLVRNKLNPKHADFRPGLAEWLDPRLTESGTRRFDAGAGNVRQAGRLCLWENWRQVKGAIDKALVAISTPGNKTATNAFLREVYLPKRGIVGNQIPSGSLVDDVPMAYVFGTLCGGTCSGTFLDIAYFLSERLGIKNRPMMRADRHPEVIGVFTIPDKVRVSEYERRQQTVNCWAALRELDFYYQPGTTYRAEFPDGECIQSTDEPFDTVYLESMTNRAGAKFADQQYSDLNQMCAMNLFTDVVAGIADIKRTLRINLRANAPGYLQRNEQNYFRAFSSFGLSAIWHPRFRIATAMNRGLGALMCVGWLPFESLATDDRAKLGRDADDVADVGRSRTKCQEQAAQDWVSFLETTRRCLLGDLPQQVRSLLAGHEHTFLALRNPEDLDAYTASFPQGQASFSEKLADGRGEYYLQIRNNEPATTRQLQADVQSGLAKIVREHTLAGAEAYVARLKELAERQRDELSQELPPFSQRLVDFSLAHDVFEDLWTRVLKRKREAIVEYKHAIWTALEKRVLDQLNRIADRYLKKALIKLVGPVDERNPGFLPKLKESVETCRTSLALLRSASLRERKELERLAPGGNVVITSAGRPDMIDDDVQAGIVKIGPVHGHMELRRRFMGDEHALDVLGRSAIDDLIARFDKSFESLSRPVTEEFLIDQVAVGNLDSDIDALVKASFPYVEPVGAWEALPVPGDLAFNFVFCHNDQARVKLTDRANAAIQDRRYTAQDSLLEHFVFFYRELIGLAVSDLAIAEPSSQALAIGEREPARQCTNFTHRAGERMFSVQLVEDFESARNWVRAMCYLDPSLFGHFADGTVYYEYPASDGRPARLPTNDDDKLRTFVEQEGFEVLERPFLEAVRRLDRAEAQRRMEVEQKKAPDQKAYEAMRAFHTVVLEKAFGKQQ